MPYDFALSNAVLSNGRTVHYAINDPDHRRVQVETAIDLLLKFMGSFYN